MKKDQGTSEPAGLGGRVSRALKKAVRRSSSPAAKAASAPAKTAKAPAEKAAAKVPAKKAAPAKTPAKKAPAKKAAAEAPAKKAPAKKAAVKQAPAKKSAAKAPAKKAPAKAPATKAAPAKAAAKAPAKKAAAKKASARTASSAPINPSEVDVSIKGPAAEDAAKKSPAKPVKKAAKAAPAKLKVRGDESPWTTKELDEVRAQLTEDIERLNAELSDIELEIIGLMQDSGDGAGDDQADAGTKTFEREHEFTVAQNSREMLEQSQRAMTAIDDGTYGICENCGNAIGKLRLQAFPRATLCLPCKQLQERH
ncbi:hypothetical protein VV02_17330 [Luteipulveratus mongoliensis]|uniref:Zinc finger DksA/TraR C4-type domain-containing protein n=1 Tax=Luteipulveratus mongoliensis TaxID=571913 RepID=A0A0K1JR25_9MICO|nr:hypothetical protein VV02_17330 [Luteipulveratus mongoliensis]